MSSRRVRGRAGSDVADELLELLVRWSGAIPVVFRRFASLRLVPLRSPRRPLRLVFLARTVVLKFPLRFLASRFGLDGPFGWCG